ncbi:MAG: NADH-quinone oxidoreductase subunit NuoK [Planctomycetes bacterium]|nr:NADH-quinone oxidoreductase subunit NuoK [Planctomycetota bacterium]MBU4399052.1 NADH-quinone oxidoreductase subunit NuoK [Planctomycetota bacterium]MCG2684307.1 NADH-quinone oxidoreductase subunit NuoK [Planctomycetales bacterium]
MHPEIALLNDFLLVGALLFGVGLIGFVSRRNMIVMFLSAEIMLQGVSLSLAAWGRFHNDFGGQTLVLLIIAVAACEAAVALALVLTLFHRRGSLDIAAWHFLREANQPPFRDAPLPEEPAQRREPWPRLPTAGVRPETFGEENDYRPRV